MKVLIFNRLKPCPKCKHREYELMTALDGRPGFVCTSCSHLWTSGKSGGQYLTHVDVRVRA
jgi:transposase-like protein